MAHDVFVSYSSKDKSVADAVCARLESRGVRCWIAPRDVPHGANYGAAIIDAIRSSRVMVLVLSSHANSSLHIPNEIERAVSYGVAILPFRIEDVLPAKSLDLFIGSVHWLDALTPPLERHLDRLAESVSKLLPDRPPSTLPVPPPVPPLVLPPPPGPNPYKLFAAAAALLGILMLGWSLWSRSDRGTGTAGADVDPAPEPPGIPTTGQEIVGCWRWGNNASVVIRANGTMTATPFTGQWRHDGGLMYTFTWPGPVDTLTMSSNRQRLTGGNQYGVSFSASRVSGGPDLPGAWRWGDAVPVVIASDGSVSMGSLSGSWELANPGLRIYRVTWPKIQDSVSLSENRTRIQGVNQYGAAVSGVRRSCP